MRLAGELDMAVEVHVWGRLAAMPGDVELDCSGLTFIDASGLRVLAAARRDCEARGAMLTIVDPSRCVVRLLTLTGMEALLAARPEPAAR